MVDTRMKKAYRTPLAHQQVNCSSPEWSVTERSDLGFVVLRGQHDDPAFLEAIAALDLALPRPIYATTRDEGSRTLLWISPDESLLLLPLAEKDAFIEQVTSAFAGLHAAVVDNSGGYACVQLSGSRALDVLKKLCAYDLGNEAFPVGRVLSTHLAKAPVIIHRADSEYLQLLIRFSFADYAGRALSAAAEEYQTTV